MDDQAAREGKRTCPLIIPVSPLAAEVSRQENGTPPAVLSSVGNGVVMERKTMHARTARIIASSIPMFMLLWIMHTGFKLATEPRRDPRYNHLAITVGVISMIFGLVNFINELAMVAGLLLELLGCLQLQEEETDPHQDDYGDGSHFV